MKNRSSLVVLAHPDQEVAGETVAAIDVGDHLVTKVRAMQSHASQKPPFPGDPEEEAARLACHEYFTLARPAMLEIKIQRRGLHWQHLPHLRRLPVGAGCDSMSKTTQKTRR